MQTLSQADELSKVVKCWQAAHEEIGLVILQRGVHPGHLKLIETSKAYAARTVVVRFFNPLLHTRADAADTYPNDMLCDEAACADYKADVLFAPKVEIIFPYDFSSYAGEDRLSRGLGGPFRPVYYRGLCTTLGVFLNLIQPTYLLWGQKDIQQIAIVHKFIKDMRWQTRCIYVPTVRSLEGIAWTSRFYDMDLGQKKEATRLLEALQLGRKLIKQGVRSPERILAEITHHLTRSRRIRVLYVALVHKDTLEPIRDFDTHKGILSASIWVDQIRLVDSLEV